MQLLNIADLPVLAAPMAGGVTTPALVAAAADTGSLGFLPAGYRTANQLADDVAAVRSRTELFGVNLFVPDRTPVDRAAVLAYRELIAAEVRATGAELGPLRWDDDDDWAAKVDLLTRTPVPWVSFTFGLPSAEDVARLRRAGSRLLVTVTSATEALLAQELRPDGLVVQSADAGGHRATFDQQATPNTDSLPDLIAAVGSATGLPIVAAGGLSDSAHVATALAAGAEAAQVGTALLMAHEAGTLLTHRRALNAPTSRTETMRAFTGRIARGIDNSFSRRYEQAAPSAYPVLHHLTKPMRRRAGERDDPEHLHLWAGTGHRLAMPGSTVELVRALVP